MNDSRRHCFICAQAYNESDFDDFDLRGLKQPPGWELEEARGSFGLGNHDPVCPDCTEEKLFAKAWELVEEQEAADRVRLARRTA
ncbi:MAG: hypothetical protein R3F35_01710 [Myxococcota bacterium]